MVNPTRVLSMLGAAALCLGVVSTASASEKRPLPQFTVTASSGERVEVASLAADGPWVLIYVAPASTPSGRVIRALEEWASEVPQVAERTVIVLAGTRDAARAFVAQLGDRFPPVRWTMDEDGTASEALRVSGTPTIIGVKAQQIEWVLAGVLNEPRTYQQVVTAWVTR